MKKKIAIIIIVIAGLTGLAIYNSVSGRGKDVINIRIAPKDAKLILDENINIKPGKVKVTTGQHTITAEREGFESQTKEFITQPSQNNLVIFILPSNSEAGEEYYSLHETEFTKIYELLNERTEALLFEKLSNYPIIEELPLNTEPLFTINYGASEKHPNNEQKFAIYISTSAPSGKYYALKSIYGLGYDPTDYEIIFEQAEIIETGDTVEGSDSGINNPGDVIEEPTNL